MNDKTSCDFTSEIQQLLTYYPHDFSHARISSLGNGHINSTFKLVTDEGEFVVQKINHHVFTQPNALCHNAQKINQHLQQQAKRHNYPLLVPQLLLCKAGKESVKLGNNYWRIMEFIPDSYTQESVSSTEQAAQVASAFALFSRALSDFSAHDLHVVIAGFHDISFRLAQLKQAIEDNLSKRVGDCKDTIDFFIGQDKFIKQVIEVSAQLPVHVTHNDTKINNLLFAQKSQKPCAVIDLDTCMPGLLMHDFGDMVRTCCSNLAEDDTNIAAMQLNIPIFQSLLVSYIQAFGVVITEQEKHSLLIGAKLLPFIIGMRFLTDHLNGDKYFHISRENHNLDRAINQMQLYKLVSESEPLLKSFII